MIAKHSYVQAWLERSLHRWLTVTDRLVPMMGGISSSSHRPLQRASHGLTAGVPHSQQSKREQGRMGLAFVICQFCLLEPSHKVHARAIADLSKNPYMALSLGSVFHPF